MTACGGCGPILVVNSTPHTVDVPPVSAFLESISGAYTTTRTHAGAAHVLFWDRHLRRLADSACILAEAAPRSFGLDPASARTLTAPSNLYPLIHGSLLAGLRAALKNRSEAQTNDELAITTLIRGEGSEGGRLDVYLHIGFYAPPVFGAGARLALAGRGRDVAAAKHSEWVRIRKGMEKMRPPSATELLLSNDGDQILEGSVTNFFVVCRKVVNDTLDESEHRYLYEVQTAPITDGILPGVVRLLVIEICSTMGIPVREVAPSWSDRELWVEAFVTNSLRLVQHVETIQAPTSFQDLNLESWKQVSWLEKQFAGVGFITQQIQGELTKRAQTEGYLVCNMV